VARPRPRSAPYGVRTPAGEGQTCHPAVHGRGINHLASTRPEGACIHATAGLGTRTRPCSRAAPQREQGRGPRRVPVQRALESPHLSAAPPTSRREQRWAILDGDSRDDRAALPGMRSRLGKTCPPRTDSPFLLPHDLSRGRMAARVTQMERRTMLVWAHGRARRALRARCLEDRALPRDTPGTAPRLALDLMHHRTRRGSSYSPSSASGRSSASDRLLVSALSCVEWGRRRRPHDPPGCADHGVPACLCPPGCAVQGVCSQAQRASRMAVAQPPRLWVNSSTTWRLARVPTTDVAPDTGARSLPPRPCAGACEPTKPHAERASADGFSARKACIQPRLSARTACIQSGLSSARSACIPTAPTKDPR